VSERGPHKRGNQKGALLPPENLKHKRGKIPKKKGENKLKEIPGEITETFWEIIPKNPMERN